MKILLTADVHYHTWPAFSTLKHGVNSRLLDIHSVMTEMISYAEKHGISHLFILGDLFHKRGTIDVITYNFVARMLDMAAKADIDTYILCGNHDQATISGTYNSLSPLAKSRVHIIDSPTLISVDKSTFYFIPFEENHSQIEKKINTIPDEADYICGHFGMAGAKLINTDYRIKNGVSLSRLKSKHKGMFLGHYHVQQVLAKDPPTMYVGSPLHHTFQDEGQEKSFIEFNLDTGKLRRVKTTYPKFISVAAKTDADIIKRVTTKDFYRVRLKSFIPTSQTIAYLNKTTLNFEILYEPSSQKKDGANIKQFDINSIINKYVKNEFDKHTKETQEGITTVLKDVSS